MYLKSIEIQGFKSFANKTVFQFHNGVTAIVGPNGSGKSNVADAVRWVLGEQRIKQLRGASMQDVIFAGTQLRKALSYASVSITLDNADHSLPVSYDEVTVTRRLYRSGESEYRLNGTACRLKDIHEIFYDTGIGKEGYSIIGQGQIDKILSGKPEDRRELFDEAVGIVKFKRRKAEAQRKLDNEQQNLTRITDILAELTRQLGPLAKQSEKARIYLNKKDQLKAYDVNAFLSDLQELKEKLTLLQADLEAATDQLSQVKEQGIKIRRMYEETEALLETVSSEQARIQEEISQGLLAISHDESQIRLLDEQIRTAKTNDEQKKQRLSALHAEAEQKQERLLQLKGTRDELETHCADLLKQDETLAQELSSLSAQSQQFTTQSDELKEKLMTLLNERADILSEAQRCDTLLAQLDIRRSERAGQLLRLDTDRADQEAAFDRISAESEKIKEALETLTKRSDDVGVRLDKLHASISDRMEEVEKGQQDFHRLSSRLETLRNIAERYDGYGTSIRKVMEQRGKEEGILGVVADLFQTDKKYEMAIETALGGSIQNIVTQDEETAKHMITFLKQNRFGRATFLPLTAMKRPSSLKERDALRESGVIGLASDLVRCESRFDGLKDNLLGRTLVTDTIDSAIALARRFHHSLRIVTLEGDLLSPGGSMSGGAYRNTSNLLGRRREIEELKEQTEIKRKTLDNLRNQLDRDRATQSKLREELRDLSEKLQQQYLRQNTNQMEEKELRENRGRTSDTYQVLEKELQEIKETCAQTLQEQEKISHALEESKRAQEEGEKQQAALSEKINDLSEREEQMRHDAEGLHIALASGEQKKDYLREEEGRLQNELLALRQESDQLSEGEDLEEFVRLRHLEKEQLQHSITDREVKNRMDREKLHSLTERKEELNRKQKQFFDQREDMTERESLLDRECYRLNSQIEKLEETRESKISYMWEEYELTYTSACKLRRDDLGSRSEWKKHMASLRKEIRELGHVNVNAIEEYKELSERHSFLSGQHEDLIKAKDALEKVIRQLDAGMRKQFAEQFSRIQVEFDQAFQQLFGGGHGSLELVDGEDVLEAGIRIIAQPPGKKLQNMMQLSGGEKSLTAIALLFAIQNLKPSPFCLLDEIEAALDENNVERYARYLHKLTKHTQFIIITHRRGTMAAADRLYGITMQEKGVSALVSVNLIEEELDN